MMSRRAAALWIAALVALWIVCVSTAWFLMRLHRPKDRPIYEPAAYCYQPRSDTFVHCSHSYRQLDI